MFVRRAVCGKADDDHRFQRGREGASHAWQGSRADTRLGSGTLTLATDTLQAGTQYSSTSATGVVTFHRWRVVAYRVIDVDNLSMGVDCGQYHFTARNATVPLELKVTKSDPKEKDSCPVGSDAKLSLLDRKVKAQPDSFAIGQPGVTENELVKQSSDLAGMPCERVIEIVWIASRKGSPVRHVEKLSVRIPGLRLGGGTQTTCLTRIDGLPGPNARMHSSGRMTFALQRRTIRTWAHHTTLRERR